MDVHGNDNTPEWGYCQVEGCKNDAIPCYLPDSDYGVDDPDALLCAEHCGDEGYCWGCGRFSAGAESFDFSPRGLCSECKDDPDLNEARVDETDIAFWWPDPMDAAYARPDAGAAHQEETI